MSSMSALCIAFTTRSALKVGFREDRYDARHCWFKRKKITLFLYGLPTRSKDTDCPKKINNKIVQQDLKVVQGTKPKQNLKTVLTFVPHDVCP